MSMGPNRALDASSECKDSGWLSDAAPHNRYGAEQLGVGSQASSSHATLPSTSRVTRSHVRLLMKVLQAKPPRWTYSVRQARLLSKTLWLANVRAAELAMATSAFVDKGVVTRSGNSTADEDG